MTKAAIVDYQLCNMFSVKRACELGGLTTQISSDKKVLRDADVIILPGVGAFGPAMESLNKLDLVPLLRELAQSGKTFIGICLGMQLLFSGSEEFGQSEGLNLIPGKVRRFPEVLPSGSPMRVPHIGWSQLNRPENTNWAKTPLKDTIDHSYVYFIHSFYAEPRDAGCILTTTNYCDYTFCSSVRKENILGFQFHPEKSGQIGAQIYKNISTLAVK